MPSRRSLALLCLVGAVSCGPPGNSNGGADGACRAGEHRCDDLVYQRCDGGAWVTEAMCPIEGVCTVEQGCTPCMPGGNGCQGDTVVQCDAEGNPTGAVLESCEETCAAGMCVGACSPEALARSYTGCVYYAADLPQWGQPMIIFATTAADQQFAVAIANPWDQPVDAMVERNDAAPGAPPIVVEVTRVQVAPQSLEVIPLPQREVNGFVSGMQHSRSALTAAAYRITTSRPTSVYQFNPQNNPNAFSNDATLLIPVNALDESYVALGWQGMGGVNFFGMQSDNRPYLTIVSARAGTRVRVVSATQVMAGDGVAATGPGGELVYTLGEFESLTLQGDDYEPFGYTDFTGSRIEADGPIAVFSGVECTNVNPPDGALYGNGCCCDHLEEQLYPRSSLSGEYVAVRSKPRSTTPEPDYWRILALSDGTAVTTSLPPPDDSFSLARGEHREILTASDFTLQATSPVMIGQFLLGQDNAESLQGDPAFILHPPITQHRQEYIFLIPSGYGENTLQMAMPAGVTPVLDGAAVAGCTRTPVGPLGAIAYEALRCSVGEGSHTIEAEAAFGLVVTGYGPGPVSYGYTGGMDFKSINEDCVDDSDCGDHEFCSGGQCVDVID